MDILVYADWKGLETPAHMGILSVKHTRGHATFTFSYDKQWVKAGKAQNLDPDLQLYDGPQFLAGSKPNFGLFLDSSPDRWGRVLMDRREAILARRNNRKTCSPSLDELAGIGIRQSSVGTGRFKRRGNPQMAQYANCFRSLAGRSTPKG